MRGLGVVCTFAVALAASCRPGTLADSPVTTAVCERVVSVQAVGRLASPALAEVSGIVPSRVHPNVFWVHNDSGHPELLFAIDRAGKLLGRYRLSSARCVDWEDIAVGREHPDGPSVLFIADTGTNLAPRTRTAVYIVPEPKLPSGDPAREEVLGNVRAVSVRYPDGRARDVEALMFDPRDAALYFVTKTTTGTSEVYRAAVPLVGDNVLQRVASIRTRKTDRRGSERVTAGDISEDGSRIVVRTYTQAFLWHRGAGQTVAEAMQTAPCKPFLAPESQGEAITFDPAGRGFYSVSEGVARPIYFHALGDHPAPTP